MYIACLKDNTVVATAMCKDIDEAKSQFTMYDDIQEITDNDFYTMPIPSKFINGEWVKTDKAPSVEYPQAEKPTEPMPENSVYDELTAAYKQGVQEA